MHSYVMSDVQFLVQEWSWRNLVITMNHIPESFEYESEDPSLSFQFPPRHDLYMVTIIWVMHGSRSALFRVSIRDKIRKDKGLFPYSLYYCVPSEDYTYSISLAPLETMGDKKYRGIKVAFELDLDTTVGHFQENWNSLRRECTSIPS